MSRDDLAALVALLRRTGLDAPGVAQRVEDEGVGPTLAGELDGSRAGAGTPSLFDPDDPAPLIAAAADELERWRADGIRPVGVLDDDYPANLRAVHDRPALIFVAGELGPGDERAIAIVGTRHPSDEGRARAAALARDFVASGITVLSGLAAGIDTAAHRAALDAGGRTVAVIGTGHGSAYPPANASLQHRLSQEHAVVSPFWPETPPSPDGFRRRNGVMSGLSRGTVIVEASSRSGTRVQARLALAHGRPVFLLAELLEQEWAAELARRPGVHVVTTAAEVLAAARRTVE